MALGEGDMQDEAGRGRRGPGETYGTVADNALGVMLINIPKGGVLHAETSTPRDP